MIRLLATGGIGNQLFQYAAVRAQAKRIGVDLAIDMLFSQPIESQDIYSFWLGTLPIRARLVTYPSTGPLSAHSLALRAYRKLITPLRWRRYVQPAWDQDKNFFAIRDGTIVSGYFQSLFYLMPRDESIFEELDLSAVASVEARALASSISRGDYVSVHVRRAGYAYGHLDYPQYVSVAMDHVRKKLGPARFLVFSDDIEWCKRALIFDQNVEFVEANQFGINPVVDLFLMSSCSHHIIANSTYSWWAAWANLNENKICVLPKLWVRDHASEEVGLVCPGWVTL